MDDQKKLKVCVIGAGAAGLCAARHLAANLNRFEFTVLEKTGDIGGTWVYTDKVGLDDDGLPIHSSMYKHLRTNLPKEIMSFPDYPEIKGSINSCVTHQVILDYLKDYANNYDLRQYIQFNTIVESVKLMESSSEIASEKWQVKLKNTKSSKKSELTFNAVMVCCGHYFDPHIPPIPGLKNFRGQVLHSHDYREPEVYTGKAVILLGASNSGVDIAFELLDKASHVYLSHNNQRLDKDSLAGITEIQGIDRFENDEFVLKDGTSVRADVLIFCTGYNFTYPFLDSNCGIKVEDNHVTPLYKHLINIDHPSMCFVGIPTTVVPFPLFHVQIQYFLSLLPAKARLPIKQDMLENSKLPAGIKKQHAHKLSNAQWSYNDELARLGNFEPLPRYYKMAYEAWRDLRMKNLKEYKNYNVVIDTDKVEIVKSGGVSAPDDGV